MALDEGTVLLLDAMLLVPFVLVPVQWYEKTELVPYHDRRKIPTNWMGSWEQDALRVVVWLLPIQLQ